MYDNLDPQQINDLNKNLTELITTLGGTVKAKTDEDKRLDDREKLTKGATAALGKLGSGAADLTKGLYKGTKGTGQFGDAVETAALALEILVLAIPGVGLGLKLAAAAAVVFAKGLNVAAKQGDDLFKTYQDLSKVGATASTGIQGVFATMQNFGYGIEELDKMVQLVSENSETLAKFSLTAADGANAFSMAMTNIVRDPALKLLGKQPDELNKAGAAFIRQQVAMGRNQKDIGDTLADSTKKYVMDLDRLQRLTGMSADAQQKLQDELLSEDAYNIYMEGLEAQGEAGQAQADKIKDIVKLLPQYSKMIAQSIGGNIEAQSKLMFIAPSLIANLRDPLVSTNDTIKSFNTQATNAKATFKDLASLGGGTQEVIGSFIDLNKSITSTTDIDARTAAAKQNAIVTDEATKNLAEVDLANMNSRDALQSFVQLGVQPATNALRVMANIARGGTGLLPGQGVGGRNSFENQLSVFGTKGTKGTKTPEGLDSELANAVTKAIAEYKQVTGKTATITSGVRDREKQERMYNEYVANGRKGKPVAPPGRSLHETGNAVDINTADANEMDRLGILKKHGLNRPIANDPVHVQLANVNRGYRNTLTGIEPNNTIPHTSPSAATAPNPMATNQSDGIMAVISQHLASLSYSNQEIASTVKKSLQRQQ